MKTRLEYEENGTGMQEALDYRVLNGGRVVTLECFRFGNWWLNRVFWYSMEYTPSEILKDFQDIKDTRVTFL